MFKTTYDLPLHRDYVAHWGLAEAVRELIQNALDSPSPFVYSFDREDDDTYTLVLNSEHTVLTPATLLLGSTTKREDADSIGSFGEGYKIALLVLLRMGYPVAMYNGDVNWTPIFKTNPKFKAEHLAIVEEKSNNKINKGLTFMVSKLSLSDVEMIKASCIRMQDHIGAIKMTQYGDILLEKPNQLFVGGLYICETDLKYGYNIQPKHVRLERDRKTVDSWDLNALVLKMWYDTKEFDFIAQMIADEVPDVHHARYDSPEMVKEACYRLFRERHPNELIAESTQQLKQMVEQGMTKTVYIGGGMHYNVSRSRGYRTEVPAPKPATPNERLRSFISQYDHDLSDKARIAFGNLVEESKNWELK